VKADAAVPSSEIMATSCGMRRPACCTARIAPKACTSEETKMALGGIGWSMSLLAAS
jgi:hypothetical protein